MLILAMYYTKNTKNSGNESLLYRIDELKRMWIRIKHKYNKPNLPVQKLD